MGGRRAGKTTAAKKAAFAAAAGLLGSKPGARSDDPEFQKPITGNSITAIWIDEDFGDIDMATAAVMSEEALGRLNELAGRMSEFFTDNKEKVTLLSPGNLTVTVAGKGFAKANHIGGESFTFDRVYVGSQKTGARLIFVFKPNAASSYTTMEMTENEAQTNLDGFRPAANLAAGGDFGAELRAVRQLDSKAREAETVKEKFNEYPEFGAW